jgi:Family of unknown function (DUF5723)
MYKNTQKLFFFLLFGCQTLFVTAQEELMLNGSNQIWHSNTQNPAFFPKGKKLVIGLPGLGLDAHHSGDVAYDDVFLKQGDKTVIDFGNAIGKLEDINTLFLEQRLETVSLGVRLGSGLRLMAGHANRLSAQLEYPKTLPDLIWSGNAKYIGQSVDIAPDINIFDWSELSAGAAFTFGKIDIGARLKWLNGVSALNTDDAHKKASLYTNPDIYQLELSTDYGFHSSSLISAFDTSGLGFNIDIANAKNKVFTSNSGFAIDLGAQIQLTEKLSVSASVVDLGGKINWSENARYFRSKGQYEYKGVDFPGTDIINGADSLDFDVKLDTLNDIFQFKKTDENFSTQLPSRYFGGIAYQLNKRWLLGVNGMFVSGAGRDRWAIGASARWSPIRWIQLGAMYSLNDRSSANIGLSAAATVGPVQVYFMSDNLPRAFSLRTASAVNLRVGAALLF